MRVGRRVRIHVEGDVRAGGLRLVQQASGGAVHREVRDVYLDPRSPADLEALPRALLDPAPVTALVRRVDAARGRDHLAELDELANA